MKKQLAAETAADAVCQGIFSDALKGHDLLRQRCADGSLLKDVLPDFSPKTEREFCVMMFMLETECLGNLFDSTAASRLHELSVGCMAKLMGIPVPDLRSWLIEYRTPWRFDSTNKLDPFTPAGFLGVLGSRAEFPPLEVPGFGKVPISPVAATMIASVAIPLTGRWKKFQQLYEIVV